MPSLLNHQSNKFTKILLMGDSGSGKTSALASLIRAGYHLRIMDFDNGLDPLKSMLSKDEAANVTFKSFRDKRKRTTQGLIFDGLPKAFADAMGALDRWKDGDDDLGKPANWGPDAVLVIDSLTFLSEAAYNWAESLNPSAKDRRQIYGAAQDAVENCLALLTGESFETNVVVISHLKFLDRPDGTQKGYPTSIGNALSPKIPAYFNTAALVETVGAGKSLKRVVRVHSTGLVDLKSPAAFKLQGDLPVESALSTIFEAQRS